MPSETSSDAAVAAPSAWPVLPRTPAALGALDLVTRHEPAYLRNHSLRSYLFARAFGALRGLRPGADYDDELLFLSTVLHDIGLSDEANGSQRFEVDGADRAAAFVREQGLGEVAAEVVWDAVALHTSPGIASRKRPEIALTQAGSGADVFGLGAENLDAELVSSAHALYPRLGVATEILTDIVDQMERNPLKRVPFSFLESAARHVAPQLPFRGLPEALAASPWKE